MSEVGEKKNDEEIVAKNVLEFIDDAYPATNVPLLMSTFKDREFL